MKVLFASLKYPDVSIECPDSLDDEFRSLIPQLTVKVEKRVYTGKKINRIIIDDEPIDSTCGKCGEREETELCPKCGAESYGNCPCKPKEEKIKEPNYPIGYIGGESKNLITTADFKRWIVQVTNKLNKVSE